MIISFRHRFAFIAIPKTGTQAVRRCLRPHLAANDWEQCSLLETRFFPVQALADFGHGHLEWRDVQPFLLPGLWQGMTSFAVVRCPYQRFISFARFAFREHGGLPPDYRDVLKAILTDSEKSGHILLRPQHAFVCDDGGQLQTSTILRHEKLDTGMRELGETLSLPLQILAPVNLSPTGEPFQFDAELREMVLDKYRADFDLFGYPADTALDGL
jgi:Sulfotransferase family